jgi:propionyl-CoA synthetase
MPLAFAVLKDVTRVEAEAGRAREEQEIMAAVDRQLGGIARPRRVYFVGLLPKTRSGKLLRRSLQALAEGRDPGDLTTIEDPAALVQIRDALGL